MVGINRQTGKPLGGWEHTVQSIQVIFQTRIGTRVQRRNFGSDIPRLIDRPGTQDRLVDVVIEGAKALRDWEPRFQLRRTGFGAAGADGVYEILLYGRYFPRGHLGDFTVYEDDKGLTVRVEV